MPAVTPIYARPVEILQTLIRFDTTNPPGNERVCIAFINGLLREAGIETTILARDDNRPNLIARLPGRGVAPPLLLYGHVDVVSTHDQPWTRDPFGGELVEGWVWGRGALDMKSGVAMMLAAFLRASAEGVPLPGDVILAVVSDEEVNGDWGSRFLVEEHPGLFEGVRYAIGEFGGYPLYVHGRKFYTITVGEKQTCSLIATARGEGGHAALPARGGAMGKLGRFLAALDAHRLPVHITPPVREMIEAIAGHLPLAESAAFRRLLDPAQTDAALESLGEWSRDFDALLHNTVNATVVRGGTQVNVLPSEITVELDARILPGLTPDDLFGELYEVAGRELDVQIDVYDPGPGEADMGLFETLADILREADPGGVPVPYILCGVTDARFFQRLGIQTYGFLPMNLPDGVDIWRTVHNADERVPASAIAFGAEAIFRALQRF